MNPIAQMLEKQAYIQLDGALATELERRGADIDHDLWSARVLLEQPQWVADVNAAYLEAGADIIASATYQASVPGFVAAGLTTQEAEQLMRDAIAVSVQARDTFWANNSSGPRSRPLVAASLGPYGACLADGSEYHGRYAASDDEVFEFHRQRVALMMQTEADLLAFETVPSWAEARVILRVLDAYPQAVAWISFSCSDSDTISHGESFADCIEQLARHPAVVAAGVNCTAPEYVVDLLSAARQRSIEVPLLAYPNSGESWDAANHRWRGDQCRSLDPARWYDHGARLLGGCCRTGPEDISAMRQEMELHCR